MADERNKKPPQKAEEAVEETAPKPKGKLGLVLRWSGFFFLSFAVINVAMYFIVQRRIEALRQPLETGMEPLAAADSTLQADSLAVDPADSLRLRIDALEREVVERDDALETMADSTAKLSSRMAQLRRELDEMQARELTLSNEEVARLSRVFGSMQPAKAAPVLLKMDNASVASILLSIEERTAAKMLGAMPPERAAGISALIKQRAEQKARDEARRNP